MLTEADFADVDFEALDAASDYGRFVRSNVPDVIRNRALARLWTSDPVFAGADPIHDYHGDFTDAAVAVKDGLQTAYRVGIGFLTDEEVAERDHATGADKQAGVDPSPAAGPSAVVDGGGADRAAAVSQPDDDSVPAAPAQRAGNATSTLAAAAIRHPIQPADAAKDAGEPEKS